PAGAPDIDHRRATRPHGVVAAAAADWGAARARQALRYAVALRALLGVDAKVAQYVRGKAFVDHVVDAVGMDRFNTKANSPHHPPQPPPTGPQHNHPLWSAARSRFRISRPNLRQCRSSDRYVMRDPVRRAVHTGSDEESDFVEVAAPE
uniref:zinc-dependent metalloprotease n=1 Tax=Nocardia cyriacigeorgica TaxID=135487 RepID=UPI003CC7D616